VEVLREESLLRELAWVEGRAAQDVLARRAGQEEILPKVAGGDRLGTHQLAQPEAVQGSLELNV
jgi:hypothetical protein